LPIGLQVVKQFRHRCSRAFFEVSQLDLGDFEGDKHFFAMAAFASSPAAAFDGGPGVGHDNVITPTARTVEAARRLWLAFSGHCVALQCDGADVAPGFEQANKIIGVRLNTHATSHRQLWPNKNQTIAAWDFRR